jgi:hypothetical protein
MSRKEDNMANFFEKIISGLHDISWIDNINPVLRKEVLAAKRAGAKVEYDAESNTVSVNRGPLAVRVYNAQTGAVIMMS